MKITIQNAQSISLFQSLKNARDNSGRIDGLTQHKIRKILNELQPHAKDWNEERAELVEKHVKHETVGEGKKKTEQPVVDPSGNLVFKSPEDEAEFLKVAELPIVLDLPYLLDSADLKQIKVSGAEFDFIVLVVQGEATQHVETPAKNGKLQEVEND